MLCLKYHRMMKCFVNSMNVRFSSFRRNYKDAEFSLIQQTLDQNHQPTTKEWSELKGKLLEIKEKTRSQYNIDTIILGRCLPSQLDVGKSYIKYLKETGCEPNTTTLIKLLKLYYNASKIGTEITKSDQQEIIGINNEFIKKFPVFDVTVGEGVIYGLLLTDDWRKSLEILDSSLPSIVYSGVVERAIHEEDEELVWKLLNEMVAISKIPINEVFTSYIRLSEKNSSSFTDNINKMLTFIGDNQILVSTEVAIDLQRAFQKFGYNCNTTAVTKQGGCQSCRKRLRNVHVTDDEFYNLSSHFLDKILIGSNVFSKTTPQELESFITFIDKTRPYDCVIDGLNVAYSLHKAKPVERANMLASCVQHFVDRKKTVVVIGRKHMAVWPKDQMNFIRKNSYLFLTDNLSTDDPFFLYSTLKSGPNTDFVTRDLIRDHAFKLDKNLKIIFRRWQQQHQYMIRSIFSYGRVTFEERIQFDMNAQQVDGCWHIPFEGDACSFHKTSFELCLNWLCVSNRR